MAYAYLPWFNFRAVDNNGLPLSGGKVYTYQAGTEIPLAVHSDFSGSTHTNPIILDAKGEALVLLDTSKAYKFKITHADGSNPKTFDNVQGGSSGGGTGNFVLKTGDTMTGALVFDASGLSQASQTVFRVKKDETTNWLRMRGDGTLAMAKAEVDNIDVSNIQVADFLDVNGLSRFNTNGADYGASINVGHGATSAGWIITQLGGWEFAGLYVLGGTHNGKPYYTYSTHYLFIAQVGASWFWFIHDELIANGNTAYTTATARQLIGGTNSDYLPSASSFYIQNGAYTGQNASASYEEGSNLGISTNSIQVREGSGVGKILLSDASGKGSWNDPSVFNSNFITTSTAQTGLTGDKSTSGVWDFLAPVNAKSILRFYDSSNVNQGSMIAQNGVVDCINGKFRFSQGIQVDSTQWIGPSAGQSSLFLTGGTDPTADTSPVLYLQPTLAMLSCSDGTKQRAHINASTGVLSGYCKNSAGVNKSRFSFTEYNFSIDLGSSSNAIYMDYTGGGSWYSQHNLTFNATEGINYLATTHKWDSGISGSTAKYQFNGQVHALSYGMTNALLALTPNTDTSSRIQAGVQDNAVSLLSDGGTKARVIHVQAGASSDGYSHQLGLTDNGNMWMRSGASGGTTWGTWKKVWSENNFDPATKANLSGASFSGAINGTSGTFNSTLQGNQLRTPSGAFWAEANEINSGFTSTSDTYQLALNYRGYDGGWAYYRDTIIYDGRKNQIVKVTGATKATEFAGQVVHNVQNTATLNNNYEMAMEYVSNTQIKIKMRGTDGVTRSTTLTLA